MPGYYYRFSVNAETSAETQNQSRRNRKYDDGRVLYHFTYQKYGRTIPHKIP